MVGLWIHIIWYETCPSLLLMCSHSHITNPKIIPAYIWLNRQVSQVIQAGQPLLWNTTNTSGSETRQCAYIIKCCVIHNLSYSACHVTTWYCIEFTLYCITFILCLLVFILKFDYWYLLCHDILCCNHIVSLGFCLMLWLRFITLVSPWSLWPWEFEKSNKMWGQIRTELLLFLHCTGMITDRKQNVLTQYTLNSSYCMSSLALTVKSASWML